LTIAVLDIVLKGPEYRRMPENQGYSKTVPGPNGVSSAGSAAAPQATSQPAPPRQPGPAPGGPAV